MLRTLLLGANGFLGNEIENFIKQHKNKDSKILKISKKEFIRDQNKMETILQGFKPDRVINIISPRLQLSPTEMQVRFSCFDAPKLIFDSIKNLEQKCTWIDCGTYWEVSENNLKSIERYYVDTKKKFKHYSVQNENNLLRYKNVVLNHLVGRHENKNRLIPTVIKNLRSNEPIYLKLKTFQRLVLRYKVLHKRHESNRHDA